MTETVSAAIERADEEIENFVALVLGAHAGSPGSDPDADGVQVAQEALNDGRIRTAFDKASSAILGIVEAIKPRRQRGLPKRPPTWWSETERILAQNAVEAASSGRALQSVEKLESYADENFPAALFAFLCVACDPDPHLR